MNPNMGPGSKPPHHLRGIDGGKGGGDMDRLTERVESLERSMLQVAMDVAFMRGRIEDMPTKDWINEKMGRQTTIILGVVGIGFAALGFLITK